MRRGGNLVPLLPDAVDLRHQFSGKLLGLRKVVGLGDSNLGGAEGISLVALPQHQSPVLMVIAGILHHRIEIREHGADIIGQTQLHPEATRTGHTLRLNQPELVIGYQLSHLP
ncbi:hypothetical protein ACFLVH_02440 [Chloroflexota bacterium]